MIIRKTSTLFAVTTLACLLLGLGCSVDTLDPPAPPTAQHTVSFVGYVYNGVTGERLSGYTIRAQVMNTAVDGTVDGDGRYVVGDVSAWDDFTIAIDAEGYRTFRSHNGRVGLPPEFAASDDIGDISTHQTLHFDAFLFPTDVQAPAVTFTVHTASGDPVTGGQLRLRPTSASVLTDDVIETPPGVPGQVWENDQDLQGEPLTEDIAGGQVALDAGTLIYGVAYLVTIYNVPGHQPLSDSFIAGVEADKTFTLSEEVHEPISVVTSTINSCAPPATPTATEGAVVIIELNQAVELAESIYPGGAEEAADDGLSITSPDISNPGVVNALNSDLSATAQEKGVSLTVSGSQVELSWNPLAGLETSDPADPITQVTYGNLGSISVQRPGSAQSAVSLSALIGSSSISCSI